MQRGTSFRILAVDDDLHSLLVLRKILKSEPYEVSEASSGPAALTIAKTRPPDLILLDILMPGMDGLEVCRQLKADHTTRSIPVIFITSLRNTEEMVKGFEAGAVDYITKPFNKLELTARVKTHLDLKRSTDIISEQNLQLKEEIDQRKQTEEKFKALSQAAFEAVLFIKNDKIIEVNDASLQVFLHDPEQLLFRPVSLLVPLEGINELQKILQGDSDGPWEMTFLRQDESRFVGQVKHQRFIYRNEQINVLAISDITRLKELEHEVRNAIVDTEERERKRFAMDVHDGLGALLSTLKIYVTLLQKPNKTEEERQFLLEEIKTNIGESVSAAKRIANNLMPSTLNDYGLFPALETFSQSVMRSGAVTIHLAGNRNIDRLAKNQEINIYRICTELINNTLKHAGASNIFLELKGGKQKMELNYKDDGKGFDFAEGLAGNPGSHGLKNILTRIQLLNGRLLPPKDNAKGASFHLEIPLN
ncbi:MAG: response regulator [Bacteroidales bacterium]|jgi:PAS domain S-box-containing protein|nr:response regulator [Bacteroidales bacterium]NLM92150.1 response regulator [Bacteroidales bacterium]